MNYIFIIILFISSHALASNLTKCTFIASVKPISEDSFNISLMKVIGDSFKVKTCSKHLGQKTIQKININKSISLKNLSSNVIVIRSVYSGMGPNGVISSISWSFEALKVKK
jgi:hypothetical protein